MFKRFMNKIILSIMALFTGCMAGCGQQAFRTVDADEFEKAILTDSVQLVDVRTSAEFGEAPPKSLTMARP